MIDINFIPHLLQGTPYGTVLDLIALTLVFFGSTRLGESISLSRYPSYRDYQASVPRLIPFTRIGCIAQNSRTATDYFCQ